MEGEEISTRDSLFSASGRWGNTLLASKILCLGPHVCLRRAAENFTSLCGLKVFSDLRRKNHSGVRHFRETTDRTWLEPVSSRSNWKKHDFFHVEGDFSAPFSGFVAISVVEGLCRRTDHQRCGALKKVNNGAPTRRMEKYDRNTRLCSPNICETWMEDARHPAGRQQTSRRYRMEYILLEE